MAQVIKEKDFKRISKVGPCVTKGIKLLGGDGYHEFLYVQLVQKYARGPTTSPHWTPLSPRPMMTRGRYAISEAVARHLTHTYGAAAFAVCEGRGKKSTKPVQTLIADGTLPRGAKPCIPFAESAAERPPAFASMCWQAIPSLRLRSNTLALMSTR